MNDQWGTDYSQDDTGWGSDVAVADAGWETAGADKVDYRDGSRMFHWRMLISALIGAAIGAMLSAVLYGAHYNPSGSNVLLVGTISAS